MTITKKFTHFYMFLKTNVSIQFYRIKLLKVKHNQKYNELYEAINVMKSSS